MKYDLQTLRTAAPLDSEAAALACLDGFDRHLVGQPVVLTYLGPSGDRMMLFAMGKRSYTEDGYVPGPDNYEIIYNGSAGAGASMVWQAVSGGSIVATGDPVRLAGRTGMDEVLWEAAARDGVVAFTRDTEGLPAIWLGTERWTEKDLSRLPIGPGALPEGISPEMTLSEALTKLSEAPSEPPAWDDGMAVAFRTGTGPEDGERALSWDEGKRRLDIGGEKAGDCWELMGDPDRRMPISVGGLKAGSTAAEALEHCGGSVDMLLWNLLFPSKYTLNYNLITREMIEALFGDNPPVWKPETDDEDEPETEDHVLISRAAIDKMIEELDGE